jgi:hypothetical protein
MGMFLVVMAIVTIGGAVIFIALIDSTFGR